MVSTIATHEKPHLDEIVAIWLLKKFGEKKFPGISKAKITYWDTGGETPDNRPAEEYEKKGTVLIGIGGGRFDEHPNNGNPRKEGECTATLVAKVLQIENDPSLEKILAFTLNNDLKAAAHPFDLAYITKLMHQQYPDNPGKVITWVIAGLEVKYQEQYQFFNDTKKEFDKLAVIEKIPGPSKRVLTLVSITTDNEQMNKFARSNFGCNADIIIQKNSSGNVQIFSNQKKGKLTFYDVVQMIRLTEQKAKGKIITSDWKNLAAEGKVEGAEEWYYFEKGQMLLNGSHTARNIPATKLTMEEIKKIVKIGVNPIAFEPSRTNKCQKIICNSTRNNECPWYKFGLHRCRKIRFEMNK